MRVKNSYNIDAEIVPDLEKIQTLFVKKPFLLVTIIKNKIVNNGQYS